MARTPLTKVQLPGNGGLDLTTGAAAVDPTNGHIVAGFADYPSNFWVVINNTVASTKLVTFKAGAYNLDATPGAAYKSKQGDVTYTCPASTLNIFGPLETARLAQADGSLWIDLAAGITGTIAALYQTRAQ